MSKNLKIIIFTLLICISFTISFASNPVKLIAALGDAPLSNQFKVKVNGLDAAVEKMEKLDIPVHYAQLNYDESVPLTIEVTVDNPIQMYTISPRRKEIDAKISGNKLSFSVHEASYLLVKINNLEDHYLLINPAIDYRKMIEGRKLVNILEYGVDSTGNILETEKIQAAINDVSRYKGVLYFPKGKYFTGELFMQSNMTVWLADEALIYGSTNPADYPDKAMIRMDSISNFGILGNGTIDGAGWAGLRANGAYGFHLLFASNCRNILIDGVVLRDPVFWNTRVYRSQDFHMKNIKMLNNRPYRKWTNTDGIDFDSSTDCSFSNAVIHAGDDNLVVKGLDNERKFNTVRILFENVLTTSNSAAAKISTETCVEYFRDITFRNIDVVKCQRGMVINGFDSAKVENIRFENFTIEGFDFNYGPPSLIDFEITDKSWRACVGNCNIDGVIISNIKILTSFNGVRSQILGKDSTYNIKNIEIKGVTVLGSPALTGDDINLSVNEFVNNIVFRLK